MLDMVGETWILQVEESNSRYVYSIKRKNNYLVLRKKTTHLFCIYNSVNAVSTIQQWSGLCFKVFCVTQLGDRGVHII